MCTNINNIASYNSVSHNPISKCHTAPHKTHVKEGRVSSTHTHPVGEVANVEVVAKLVHCLGACVKVTQLRLHHLQRHAQLIIAIDLEQAWKADVIATTQRVVR